MKHGFFNRRDAGLKTETTAKTPRAPRRANVESGKTVLPQIAQILKSGNFIRANPRNLRGQMP
jgi:hypothetical protein